MKTVLLILVIAHSTMAIAQSKDEREREMYVFLEQQESYRRQQGDVANRVQEHVSRLYRESHFKLGIKAMIEATLEQLRQEVRGNDPDVRASIAIDMWRKEIELGNHPIMEAYYKASFRFIKEVFGNDVEKTNAYFKNGFEFINGKALMHTRGPAHPVNVVIDNVLSFIADHVPDRTMTLGSMYCNGMLLPDLDTKIDLYKRRR